MRIERAGPGGTDVARGLGEMRAAGTPEPESVAPSPGPFPAGYPTGYAASATSLSRKNLGVIGQIVFGRTKLFGIMGVPVGLLAG